MPRPEAPPDKGERERWREGARRVRLPRLSELRVPIHPRARRFGHAIRGRIPRLPRIRSVISPADVFTLTNGMMGFLAIATVTGVIQPADVPRLGQLFPGLATDDRFLFASVLLVIGMIADALDGIVARKFGGSRLGGDLDTLSDTISFVVAPAFMVFAKYGADQNAYPALIAAGLVLIMGMLRLARFNSNPTESSTVTFQGLPTPWCAVAIALLILAGIPVTWALPIIVVLAFLMMSNVAYPKSRGKATILALVMAGVALVTVGVILFFPNNQPRVLRASFTLVMLAVALLPFFIARRGQLRRVKE
ncbi:MAG: CDP-alcohol phosphatidyltransferase family protein [Candidatus Thermoplasmatota archaeon]